MDRFRQRGWHSGRTTTYFVAADMPIRILKGGVGAVIMQDAIGHEKTIAVKIGYANQRKMGFGSWASELRSNLITAI